MRVHVQIQAMYRAYSSNKVVEFRKIAKESSMSAIGQLIGLEPYTVACRWEPAADGPFSDPCRPGIEGLYLMQDFPPSLPTGSPVSLAKLPDGARVSISKTLKEIERKDW